MSKKELLEKFGRILIKDVRDEVLEKNDLIASGQMGGKENQEIYEKIRDLDEKEKEFIRQFAKQAIDSTIHHFLWMIEQNEEYDLVKYNKDKSETISLRDTSDGLCGELYTEEGWIERFSKYPPSIK
ncbi:hypothetical protein [Candidatus Nucleicultrix amoebiphila]|uniref:Uncharacterized protein n=1 Tax=Candidatus Nucleicultrix amoebiphila FS5 TaxID=1414854 RepID=A0A1W6N576_9PROT|nr:hypothetical protein [Candidatus Nucleicultrix amoebiphila]ARN84928.1 hypothetical protein GQ61_06110 [Candidatus Nucleicultrix amoebiphila FS5]